MGDPLEIALVIRRNGAVVAGRTYIAGLGGLMGLMFRRGMDDDEAMIFRLSGKRTIVHTFFLRFPVDLVFTDSRMRVLEIRANLPPWRFYLSGTKPSYMLELPGGKTAAVGLRVGDELETEELYS
ncbi:MAG: DUF192 domain-containing protein [Candidatus Hadarchaeales archaeon]